MTSKKDSANFGKKKILFYCITVAMTIVVIGILCEILLRIYMVSSRLPFENPDIFYYVPDPDTGVWMGDPDKSRPFINSYGMYDVGRKIDKKEGVFRIAVIGDSYMNGIHAGLGFRMSDLIENKLEGKVEALNFGISSVGTVQELFIYKSKAKQFKADLVILGFLAGNDVRNNAEKGTSLAHGLLPGVPYCVIRPDGTYQYVSAQPVPGTNRISYTLRKYSRLYRFIRMSVIPKAMTYLKEITEKEASNTTEGGGEKNSQVNFWPQIYDDFGVYSPPVSREWLNAWAITEHTLLEFKKEVEGDGSKFMLLILTDPLQVMPDPENTIKEFTGMSLPKDFSVDYPTERLVAFAEKNNIDCFNLLPIFRRYAKEQNLKEPYFSFKTDGHWSRLGHQVASDAVYDYIVESYNLNNIR